MIKIKHKGDFSKTTTYFGVLKEKIKIGDLEKYGEEGVEALRASTPIDTGLTASSWKYRIIRAKDKVTLDFYNENNNNGVPIAIILQYGHATRNGGWVEGRDYINPAIRPLFDKMAKNAWEEVTRI